jgi:hypothetical protein
MWEPADGGGNGRAGGPDTFVLCSDIAGPWARTASFLTTEDEARATEGHRRLSLSQQNCDARTPVALASSSVLIILAFYP